MWCHLLLLVPLAGLGFFFVLPWPVALGVNAPLTAIALGIAVPAMRTLRQPVVTGGRRWSMVLQPVVEEARMRREIEEIARRRVHEYYAR